METIWSKKICGKRGGQKFMDQVRPNSTTGVCPQGFSACSPNSIPENTLCYKPDDKDKCPITQVIFKNIFNVYEFSKAPYYR
jgi:hypothetical protein